MVIYALNTRKSNVGRDSNWLGQVGRVVPEGPSEEVTFVMGHELWLGGAV